MTETLDVWVIVPKRPTINICAAIKDRQFFFTHEAAAKYWRTALLDLVGYAVRPATMTMETENA